MKKRWKVGMALGVVGMAGFLVWAFRSPATPPFSIRFCGYVTNDTSPFTRELAPQERPAFALFAVTNQSDRALFVSASANPQPGAPYIQPNVTWAELGSGSHVFKPGEGAIIRASVQRIDEPIQVSVQGVRNRATDPPWSQFLGRLPWQNRIYSATATSEPR